MKAAKPVLDVPFFSVNDNRLSYSYVFQATDPGYFSIRPDGSINGKTEKQVLTLTHYDEWAYGTNFALIDVLKSGHNDPAAPCVNAGVLAGGVPSDCAGSTEVYGLFRSTFGLNQIFNTNAFSWGALRNVSLEVGGDFNSQNNFVAPAKRVGVVGAQFAFALPYNGYLTVAPLYYKESNHNGFNACGFAPAGACLVDGNTNYRGTWSVETNYAMDLGFLPESIRYFSISGRATWRGKKGLENAPLTAGNGGGTPTAVELNSEPIRLTFDAGSAFWGKRYAHHVDLWVAYRYWRNKFGLDASRSLNCVLPGGQSNHTCTESTVVSGLTVKF